MKLAPLVALVLIASAASPASAEPPKTGETYSCVLTFTLSTWSKSGVKARPVTEGPIRQLVKVLDRELEVTSVSRDEATVGHYPIIAREDDSIVAENPTKNGQQYPGRHVLYRMADRVAVYIDESNFRNGGGGVTMTTRTGTCRLAW